jgi:N-methylhydantoinase B/oxoprolinase/acetone carboxylase alpha subunit
VSRPDAIELELLRSLLASITEEMGAALERSAFSPNIKERRDDSCAIFDERGQMVAMGEDLPVHLGAMAASVAAFIERLPLGPGDVGLLNDPFSGGSHLPDLTMVQAVYAGERLLFYVANRAHHSDMGGSSPGSMTPAEEIYQEGLILPPVRLVRGGHMDEDLLALILANVRTPEMRRGDLVAQLGACRLGERRLLEAYQRLGDRLLQFTQGLLDSTERQVRHLLASLPSGTYRFSDAMDQASPEDPPIRIQAALTIDGDRAVVDFGGSSPQVRHGGINCPFAVTLSAVYYCFRCLLEEPAPFNGGFGRAIEVRAEPGTLLNAQRPAAVAAGNVETSQRIVDVVLGALAQALPQRIPAASQGTMNNLSFGGLRSDGTPFAYYETVGGGTGGWAGGPGEDGIQSHMTNTRNTPVEALELELPVFVRVYRLRHGSGGAGQQRGGAGIVREIEFLEPATVSILSERRLSRPYGLAGGGSGARGRTLLLRAEGSKVELPPRASVAVRAGDAVRVETPGGGGFKPPQQT